MIYATSAEIDVLLAHLLDDPADGPIRLANAESGCLVAVWSSDRGRVSLGPSIDGHMTELKSC